MIHETLTRDLARAGWIAATVMAVLTAGWVLTLVAVPGPAAGAAPIERLQYIAGHPETSLGPALVATLALLHVPLWLGLAACAWPRRPAAALLGLCFGLVYAPLASINYWSQLTVVRGLAELSGTDPAGAVAAYRLFEFPGGLTSLSYGIDVLAYAVWGCAAIAMAWAIAASATRIARVTAVFFGLGGGLALVGAAGFVVQHAVLELGVLVSGVAFLGALVGSAELLRRHGGELAARASEASLELRMSTSKP